MSRCHSQQKNQEGGMCVKLMSQRHNVTRAMAAGLQTFATFFFFLIKNMKGEFLWLISLIRPI
jgi:hypothetical protein